MAKLPDWFPKSMEDVYRMDPSLEPTIQEPRVAESHGGGMCPEQHWGVLTDGRVFYFRMRHGRASLRLAPHWFETECLPASDPRITMEQWDEAYNNGARGEDLPQLWLGPIANVTVTEENDGWFNSEEECANAFAQCLDQIWDEPFDEDGWAPYRKNMPKPV